MRKLFALLLLLLLRPAFCLAATSAVAAPFESSLLVMGTVGRVQIWGLPQAGAEALAAQIFEVWKQADAVMSLYKPHSDLVRLNAGAGQVRVRVSPALIDILRLCEYYREKTDGLFDARVGALMDLWGLGVKGAEGRLIPPRKETLAQVLLRMRECAVVLDDNLGTAEITQAGVKIDLGGIAKGYALDEAAKAVRASGATRAILDLGGQLWLYHPPPEGWDIGLREPGSEQRLVGSVNIRRTCSLSTSSQDDRFLRQGQKHYGHVLDPRNGRPFPKHGAMTVMSTDAVSADVLSKAFFMADAGQRREWEKEFGVEWLEILPGASQGEWVFSHSPDWQDSLDLRQSGGKAL